MQDKSDIKSKEIVAEPKKAFQEKQEPIRFRLRKVKLLDLDDGLKSITKVKN